MSAEKGITVPKKTYLHILGLIKCWIEQVTNVLTVRTATTGWYDKWRLTDTDRVTLNEFINSGIKPGLPVAKLLPADMFVVLIMGLLPKSFA